MRPPPFSVAAGCSSSDSGGETRGTLAFAAGECCGDPERIPLDIWLMNGDGSDSRQLTRDAGSQFTPSWSPSGRLLVVGSPEGLYVIDADGSGRRKLVRSGAVHPIWSPNGEEIAFTRNTDGYVVEADGSGLRRLGNGFPGDWSPDGEKIAVTDNSQIRVFGADGGGSRRLSRPEGND